MQVILLAAGRSARLDPISDKNLLEFNGKTLIEHRVSALKKANLRDIVVVGGKHNINELKNILKKYKNLIIVEQKDLETGQAGGVLAGAKAIKHKNIMVVSANDVFDFNLFEEAVKAAKSAKDGLIVGKTVKEYFPGGYLSLDKDKYITDIIEKPKPEKVPSNMINIVLHIFNDFPSFLEYLKNTGSKKDDIYETALNDYIKKGKAKLKTFKYNDFWQPIKFPWHILSVMEYFLKNHEHKISKKAEIAKTAVIKGDVTIEPGVKILENAVVQGPAYIGENVVIGNNCLIRESMVGKNCIIGYSTEVARSFLNKDIWTHTAYIGDSIIDSNVSLGAGTILGNLRFDEKNVLVNIKNKKEDTGTNKFGAIIGAGARFGINSSTNPGVKVGKNTFIGGNVIIEKDIPEGKLVILDQKLKITQNKTAADVTSRKDKK